MPSLSPLSSLGIHRIKCYNDVIFVVSDGRIVGWKNRSVLVELAKPFLINTIYKEMMKRKDRVVWGRRYIYHGSTHDYVNLVRSKGVDIWQTITGLCTDVASQQDIFRIAAWLFAIGWQVKSFKPESKVDFFFGWKCHCISLFSCVFFLFLLSAWSLPKQVCCSLRGHTSLSGNGFVHWCKWRTSCQSICPLKFHQLGSLHQEFQEALQNK